MKIVCIARNYGEHAAEMGVPRYQKGTAEASAPAFFLKPESALRTDGQPFAYPSFSQRVEHEVEVVVRICKPASHIGEAEAATCYDAVTVGIDFTARDLQQRLRSQGLPWEISKGFDGSAVVGEMVRKEELPDIQDLHFRLEKNGETVQQGHTRDMLFKVDEIVSYISQFFTLKMGDLIYTGTPAGVGLVKEGDHLAGYLEDRKVLEFNVR